MVRMYNRSGGIVTYGATTVPVLFGSGMCVAVVAAPAGDNPVPDDDTPVATPTLDFEFGTAVVDADSNTAEFSPYDSVHIESFKGLEVITDGFFRNREYDGDRVCFLEIEAAPVAATAGESGTGITGNYKYVYRFKNSKTGKVSGFTPIMSDALIASPSNQQVDLTAFTLSGDGQVDYIEIFRSLSDDYSAYYYVDEVANSGTPTYTDTTTDDTLQFNERWDVVQGRTFNEGIMWPVLKSTQHLGAMYYYGVMRMPTYAVGTISGTAGNNFITMDVNTGCLIRENRRGQKLKIAGSDVDFQITSFDLDVSPQKAYIYPFVPPTFGPTNATYTVEDNRNGMLVQISEFGWNGSVPTSHEIELGSDRSDNIVDMFVWNGKTYFGSIFHLFEMAGDKTITPWNTTTRDIVSNEGPCGPKAGTVIPGVGYVYVDQKLGPRLFNGENSMFLGPDREETTIRDEWARIKHSRRWEIVVRYSRGKNLIYFSYSRDNEVGNRHIMVFSLATGEWLGPWTIRMSEYGELRHTSGTPLEVIGSDLGALFQDYKGTRDGFSSGDLTGTLTGVSGRVFTDSGASLLNTGEGLYAAIVEFLSPTSEPTYAYVVSNDGTTFTTLNKPSPYPEVGWTFIIAPVPWVCKTGYIDLGNPHKQKEMYNVHTRWERGSSGTVRCAVGVDGADLYEVASGEENIAATVRGRFMVQKTGNAFQIQMDGSGVADEPAITRVVAFIEVTEQEDA